jgi:hypothetical protein
MTDEQIEAECIRRDANPGLIYFISLNTRTFALRVASAGWSSLNRGERWCMVKNRNIFNSAQEAQAAIDRALNPQISGFSC